jgi:hypothetical protein
MASSFLKTPSYIRTTVPLAKEANTCHTSILSKLNNSTEVYTMQYAQTLVQHDSCSYLTMHNSLIFMLIYCGYGSITALYIAYYTRNVTMKRDRNYLSLYFFKYSLRRKVFLTRFLSCHVQMLLFSKGLKNGTNQSFENVGPWIIRHRYEEELNQPERQNVFQLQ